MMKKQQNMCTQAASVFIFALLILIVVNYFGSLFIYDELRLFIAFDALCALIITVFHCVHTLYKRITELEHRIETLEYQLKKK